MKRFNYARATDPVDAVTTLTAGPGAMFLGGGTNLVDLMKLGILAPDLLVDVSRLSETRIEPTAEGGLLIGAAVRNSDLAADPVVRTRFPLLSRALLSGASGQLRNMATVGGNLMQRNRCTYYLDITKACNKRSPGSGCSARLGYHRNHAILGASQACIAVHPSDMAVALTALDAVVYVADRLGGRAIPLTEFYRLPTDEPDRETVLEHGELITAVELPGLPMAAQSTYRKVRDRASYAFALVSVAVAVDIVKGVIRDVRIALGGVAPVPWRARLAEKALRGKPPTEKAFRDAAVAELAAADPLPGNTFKVNLAERVLISTLSTVSGGSR